MNYPYIKTDNEKINTAFHIALSDFYGNIKPFKGGLLKEDKPVIIAGMGYCTPWTRDAAINTYFGGALLFPDAAKDTLLSVLKKENGKIMIDGEYWDSIIWAWGAWTEYLATGDKEFLKIAFEATKNSLEYFENSEFDSTDNLFRVAACYGDGVSAYPDIYASHGESGIITFATECKDKCVDNGVGIPMKALSTNCLYYYAYVIADYMASELNEQLVFSEKANRMKDAINKNFWMSEKGYYRYLVDDFGGCDYFEGIGNSFAILFDIADDLQKKSILKNSPVTSNGIACVYPSFNRYLSEGGYGRHSGTVWPHIQAFWSDAAFRNKDYEITHQEFVNLTKFACRDGFFAEIYHPDTGEIYGGLQEKFKGGIIEWDSVKKQTWSATGYLHIIFTNIIGMDFKKEGVYIKPVLPPEINYIELKGLKIRNMTVNISIKAENSKTAEKSVFIPYTADEQNIEIIIII